MRQVSNNDYSNILRLLCALSKTNGASIREKENARKAALLHRKLTRKEAREHGSKRDTRKL